MHHGQTATNGPAISDVKITNIPKGDNPKVLAAWFLKELKTKNEAHRIAVARELHRYMNAELRDQSADFTREFLHVFDHKSVQSAVYDCFRSQDQDEKKAGIFIIVCLMESPAGNDLNRVNRFGKYLTREIEGMDERGMELAARAITFIMQTSTTEFVEWAEKCLESSLEWLTETVHKENRRLAAAFILKELALFTSTSFFRKAKSFLDGIFNIIHDPKPSVRVAAANALRAALAIISEREAKQKGEWFKDCMTEAYKCVNVLKRDDGVHAMLLMLNEILRIADCAYERTRVKALRDGGVEHWHTPLRQLTAQSNPIDWLLEPRVVNAVASRTARSLAEAEIEKLMKIVVDAQSSKSPHVQAVLLELIPRFTGYFKNPRVTERGFPASLMDYCLPLASRNPDAMVAIGLLVLHAKDTYKTRYLGKVLSLVKEVVHSAASSKKKTLESSAYVLLALLVQAYKKELKNETRDLLQELFSIGLCPGLSCVLHQIFEHIEDLRPAVRDGVMGELCMLLTGRPMPNKLEPPPAPFTPTGPLQLQNVPLVVLALRSLGEYDLHRHSLHLLVPYIAEVYLVCESVEVRLAAVRCLSEVLTPFVIFFENAHKEQKGRTLHLLHHVIRALVSAAIVDQSVDVRLCVMRCFSEADRGLLQHLAQAEIIELEFMTLNDEKLEMQEAAVALMGQLANLNPSAVLPRLRQILLEMLSQLTNSRVGRLEQHSARIISRLASYNARFIRPYMGALLTALLPKLRMENKFEEVTVSVLDAIGELASIGGSEIVRHVDELFPKLVGYITDSTSLKRREAALRVMGRVCQATGYVVDPYREYPSLLDELLKLLKTEMAPTMRFETIKVLGILGALDPYTHKVFTGAVHSALSNSSALSLPEEQNDHRQEVIEWFNYERCTLEEFYPLSAIGNLMRLLSDDSLHEIHNEISQAILTIFTKLGSSSVEHVQQVVPRLIEASKSCNPKHRSFFLNELASLISTVGKSAKPYMRSVLSLIAEAWCEDKAVKITVVSCLEKIGKALGMEFSPYVAELIPYLLTVVKSERGDERALTEQVLKCVKAISPCLPPHLHLVLPPILLVLDDRNAPMKVRLSALETIIHVGESEELSDFAPRIMQVWTRCISEVELQRKLLDLLVIIVKQMWRHFSVFKKNVNSCLEKNGLNCPVYYQLIEELAQLEPTLGESTKSKPRLMRAVAQRNQWKGYLDRMAMTREGDQVRDSLMAQEGNKRTEKQRVNFEAVKAELGVDGLISATDWKQWVLRFQSSCIRFSSSASIRACVNVVKVHQQLAKDLFNGAFMSVWTELNEGQQNDITKALEDAINKAKESSAHSEVVHTILNLTEFMDHSEKGPLPLKLDLMSSCAVSTKSYAKALRFRELIMQKDGRYGRPNEDDSDALITYASKLYSEELAAGIVTYNEKNNKNLSMQGRWYEKLNDWEKALEQYASKAEDLNDDTVLHEMRCLEALGRWSELNERASSIRQDRIQHKAAVMAARGAWAVGNWDSMSTFVQCVNENHQDGCFLRAVLAVKKNHFEEAIRCITKAREMYDSALTAMASESYERAYGVMVLVQQLSELEECIEYKMRPERRARISLVWSRRLQGCREHIEQWSRLMLLRSLVLTPDEMRPLWVKFSSLCRQQGKSSMSRDVLKRQLNLSKDTALHEVSNLPVDKPQLTLAVCKQLWADGFNSIALRQLENLQRHLAKIPLDPANPANAEAARFHAKVHLKLGEWTEGISFISGTPNATPLSPKQSLSSLDSPLSSLRSPSSTSPFIPLPLPSADPMQVTQQVLKHYTKATTSDPNWHKAWHKLASAYYNAIMNDRSSRTSNPFSTNIFGKTVATNSLMSQPIGLTVYAVRCFCRALQLAEGSRLEDTLRLLALWFDKGEWAEVHTALRECLKQLPVETWLEVIPQLIARLDSKEKMVALVKNVMLDIARSHPQALLYALTQASKSRNEARASNAKDVLIAMKEICPVLVDETKLVNDELVRCAILWHEQWNDGLDDASRLYFQEKNVKGMLSVLEPLHDMIEKGAKTLKEQSFNQTYMCDLSDARKFCQAYTRTGNNKELTQAWDVYLSVFKRISLQLKQISSLDLNYISPELTKAKDMHLCVPGTYDPSAPLISIASFGTYLQVISSKQRPRKMTIRGSDGHEFAFLLKGHEDPRQDERVMQLFGLVNTLLVNNADTCRKNLTIQRYSIVALSQNTGLIGWVPNCDTLHALIREYRDKKKIPLTQEHKVMNMETNDLEQLTIAQKVQVFQLAVEATVGDDLQQILWLKSPNSEVWFERRTNYTRSMACMSMVGHILGLGDRHPSNLMLDRLTGKIVHIDFGDCFEVAMNREKYPEKIPFRLTRMLIRAMEVTGIDGNYRITCERVLKMLRGNSESLLAVLEAFVYDPLINWRLLDVNRRTPGEKVDYTKAKTQELPESVSEKVISRIKDKLTGREGTKDGEILDVPAQVQRLIEQATCPEHLCQCYVGWCPFW